MLSKTVWYDYLNNVIQYVSMSDAIDDATKKIKNTQQDYNAKAETTEDHAEGKPSSETLNKAKEKVKDAFS
jgi:hypothetical protein